MTVAELRKQIELFRDDEVVYVHVRGHHCKEPSAHGHDFIEAEFADAGGRRKGCVLHSVEGEYVESHEVGGAGLTTTQVEPREEPATGSISEGPHEYDTLIKSSEGMEPNHLRPW